MDQPPKKDLTFEEQLAFWLPNMDQAEIDKHIAEERASLDALLLDSDDPSDDLKQALAITKVNLRRMADDYFWVKSDYFWQNMVLHHFANGESQRERIKFHYGADISETEIDEILGQRASPEKGDESITDILRERGHQGALLVTFGKHKTAIAARELEVEKERALRKKGGKARHRKSDLVKQFAIAQYRAGKYKSTLNAADSITPTVLTYARKIDARMAEGGLDRRIYLWLLAADKQDAAS